MIYLHVEIFSYLIILLLLSGICADKFCLKQIVCKSPDFLFIFIFENIFLPVDLPGVYAEKAIDLTG